MLLRPVLAGCLLLVSASWNHCLAHRYVAALNFPGSGLAQCALNEGDPRTGTAAIKVDIETAGSQIVAVKRSACGAEGWQVQSESSVSLPVQLNHHEHGFDQLDLALPRSALPDAPAISARLIALSQDGAFRDLAEAPIGLSLSSAGNPLGVPSLGPLPKALLILAILVLAGLLFRQGRSGRLAANLLVLGTLGLPLGMRSYAELSVAPSRLEWQDAGYDHGDPDAALDLRHGAMMFSARDLRIEIAVNNLEPALLGTQDRMLFIGNSLTGTHNVPGLLSKLAAQAGKQLDARAQIIGGSSLEDHMRSGNATREIAAGRYPVVSLQQGPSSLPENQLYLRTWTERFNPHIRAAGGRPLLYMVWPDRSRVAYFSDVYDSYRNAALAVDGAFAPAGQTWLAAWERAPDLALYGSDDFHPTLLGSYVAALSLFCTVYQQSPEGLPAYIEQSNGSRSPLPAETARLLQQAAWDVYRRDGLRGRPL